MRPPHSSEARGSIQWERRDQSLSDLERRDGILLHEEVDADASHRHVLAQSEHQSEGCLRNADSHKVLSAQELTAAILHGYKLSASVGGRLCALHRRQCMHLESVSLRA